MHFLSNSFSRWQMYKVRSKFLAYSHCKQANGLLLHGLIGKGARM